MKEGARLLLGHPAGVPLLPSRSVKYFSNMDDVCGGLLRNALRLVQLVLSSSSDGGNVEASFVIEASRRPETARKSRQTPAWTISRRLWLIHRSLLALLNLYPLQLFRKRT